MTSSVDYDPIDAVRALRQRGVDDAEALLEFGTPGEILAACHRWDGCKGVRKGLLVKWIREQDFTEPAPAAVKAAPPRARFDEYARRFPVGAIAEAHLDLIARRWPDELDHAHELGEEVCAGSMVVVAASYPVLEMECGLCGFVACLTPRSLHVLPDGLLAEARP